MKYYIIFFLFISLFFFSYKINAQGHFSGDLMLNANFYQRDSAIGAAGIPLYDNLLSGGEGWLNLNYKISDFDFGVRFDLFNNSNIHNPLVAYAAQGIGAWYARKKIDNLTITGGYIYDQFGSGLVFRAYEERGLGIDNALVGLHIKYDFLKNWTIKGFTGRQKDLFSTYRPVIKGANIEKYSDLSENLSMNTGGAFVNRTMDQQSMSALVTEINSYSSVGDRFVPKYNVYVYSLYNTLTFKNLSWYIEYAGKTNEAIRNFDGNKLIDKPGSVILSNVTYSRKGIGITLQGRRTEYFSFRTSPNEIIFDGIINYLPAFTRQNSYRLLARYNAAAQELGEMAVQGNIVYTPKKGYTFLLNVSNVTELDTTQYFGINDYPLFREVYFEFKAKPAKKILLITGVQYVEYNQAVYEFKPGAPIVQATTPFMEFTYKLSKKNSIRTEWQYQFNEQDYGSWLYGLIEYNIAPNFSFSAGDMYNIEPKKTDDLHYYTFSSSFTHNAHKLTVSYVRQVEGIVCTGGICRFEPAFSGLKATLTSGF